LILVRGFVTLCAAAALTLAGAVVAGGTGPGAGPAAAPGAPARPRAAVGSARTLVLGIRVDREQARVLAFTVKERPFRAGPELPAPRPYVEGRPLQAELTLLGPGGTGLTRRVDVGAICLTHGPDHPPHVAGDTILLHRDSFLVELPELSGFDVVEVAIHERERGELQRRSLGRVRLDRASFVPAGGRLSYRDLAFADRSAAAPESLASSGAVIWPEDVGDPELYRVYGDPDEGGQRINVVIVPDGYTYAEKALMQEHADALVQHFRQKTPYGEHDPFINYTLVYAYSVESGTDQCDCDVVADTAMGTRFPNSGYPCGASENRCLYYGGGCDTNSTDNILDAELRAPYQDETIVMVNTPRYGGCGGARAVYSAANSAATEIAVHELGHSLGGLADEYGGDPDCGNHADEINTSLIPGIGAWPEWVAEIGPAWEGGQYFDRCVYRPLSTCEMRALNQPFCPVCNQQWALVIFGHPRVGPTAPLAAAQPPSPVAAFTSIPVSFSVQTRLATGPAVTNEIEWSVQGPADPEPVVVATDRTEYVHTFEETGTFTVACRVTADTNFIKPVKFGANVDEAVWLVDVAVLAAPSEVSAPGSGTPLVFSGTDSLAWEDAAYLGAWAYNLYRGDLSGLAAGGYGDCDQPGLESNGATAAAAPPVGTAWFYLVSGVNPAGEGPLGLDSQDRLRVPAAPCQ